MSCSARYVVVYTVWWTGRRIHKANIHLEPSASQCGCMLMVSRDLVRTHSTNAARLSRSTTNTRRKKGGTSQAVLRQGRGAREGSTSSDCHNALCLHAGRAREADTGPACHATNA